MGKGIGDYLDWEARNKGANIWDGEKSYVTPRSYIKNNLII